MTVSEINLTAGTIECDYHIVTLSDGRFAFVWGNIQCHIGDSIPQVALAHPSCERGIEIYTEYGDARDAYVRCADAIGQTNPLAKEEMMTKLRPAER